jgi:hypothetical protein
MAQISWRQHDVCDLLDSACTEDLKLRREEERREKGPGWLIYIQGPSSESLPEPVSGRLRG